MRHVIDNIEPYNDIWLDCVSNNIMAMLLGVDESFRSLPLTLNVTYSKYVTDQKYDTEEDRVKMLTEGFLFPTVNYSTDTLSKYLDGKEYSFHEFDQQLIDFIKSGLVDGYSVFLVIDRYYYPSGREAGTMHMVHPVFLIGFDDDKACFIAIEDCIIPGLMDYYDLPFNSVKDSCMSFVEQGKSLTVCMCKPHATLSIQIGEETKEATDKMIWHILEDTTAYFEQYNLYIHKGLSALEMFHDEIDHLFRSLKEPSLFRSLIMRFPQLHLRNKGLVTFLYESGYISKSDCNHLVQQYELLQIQWEIFKNRCFLMIERNEEGFYSKTVLNLLDRMGKIIEMERSIAEKFKSSLNHMTIQATQG